MIPDKKDIRDFNMDSPFFCQTKWRFVKGTWEFRSSNSLNYTWINPKYDDFIFSDERYRDFLRGLEIEDMEKNHNISI